MKRIESDKPGAVDDYIRVTNTSSSEREELLAIVRNSRNVYTTEPQATEKFTEFLARTRFLDVRPASWKDYFFDGLYAGRGS
jgi:NitT/TauT family transport system substrate-binding protein